MSGTFITIVVIFVSLIALVILGLDVWIIIKNSTSTPIAPNPLTPPNPMLSTPPNPMLSTPPNPMLSTPSSSPNQFSATKSDLLSLLQKIQSALKIFESELNNFTESYKLASPDEKTTMRNSLINKMSMFANIIQKINSNLINLPKNSNLGIGNIIFDINQNIMNLGRITLPIIKRSLPLITQISQPFTPNQSVPVNSSDLNDTIIELYRLLKLVRRIADELVSMWYTSGLARYTEATNMEQAIIRKTLTDAPTGANALNAKINEINRVFSEINSRISKLDVEELNNVATDANRYIVELNQIFLPLLSIRVDLIKRLVDSNIDSVTGTILSFDCDVILTKKGTHCIGSEHIIGDKTEQICYHLDSGLAESRGNIDCNLTSPECPKVKENCAAKFKCKDIGKFCNRSDLVNL